MTAARGAAITVRALTPARWQDFAALFGERGACGGCWCMLWRLPRQRFDAGKRGGNRAAMRELVASGAQPGLLAYRGREPVGWCSLAPRVQFPALRRSRLFKALLDDAPARALVWSVTCLFVHKDHRRRGVSVALLRAAVEHVRKQRGSAVEGYPQAPQRGAIADVFAWTGTASAFVRAGFREVARPSPTRPVMRVELARRTPATPARTVSARATRTGTTRASRTA